MATERVGLVRALGVVPSVSIVVGTVIGTGIFLKPRAIAALLTSPELVLAVWVIGGALSLLGALSYAELGALFPQAGGEYVFVRETYGRLFGFLWAWTYFVCAKIGSIAALAAGFAIYLKAFVPLPGFSEQAAAILAISLLTVVNVFGVITGGRLQTFLTLLKVGSILAIMALAFAAPTGSWDHLFQARTDPSPHGFVGAFGLALVAVLWAYDGWNNLVMVSAEIRDPERNIKRAMFWGMLVVVLLYVAVNVAYHYAVPFSEMPRHARVAEAAVVGSLGPRGASLLSGIILVSILGALNGAILTGARIPYAAAVDGLFPSALARVQPTHRTPARALLAQGCLAVLLMAIFTILGLAQFDILTDMVIFAEWAFYALCTAGVIVLRRRIPDAPRPYRAWGYPYAQILFVLCAVYLFLNSLIAAPRQSFIGLGLILLGLPVYLLLQKGKGPETPA